MRYTNILSSTSTSIFNRLFRRRAVRLPSDRRDVGRSRDRVGATRTDGGRRCGRRDHLLRDGIAGLRGARRRRVDPARRSRCADQPSDPRRPVHTTAYPSRRRVSRLRAFVTTRLQLRRTRRYAFCTTCVTTLVVLAGA